MVLLCSGLNPVEIFIFLNYCGFIYNFVLLVNGAATC
jgi:hypothetical protein